MTEQPSDESLSPSQLARVNRICNDFESAWRSGSRPRLEDYLAKGDDNQQAELFEELLKLEWDYLQGDDVLVASIDFDEYLRRFPQFTATILRLREVAEDRRLADTRTSDSAGRKPQESQGAVNGEIAPGEHIGRYRIERRIDAGSFGAVYLGVDIELDRKVAIKVEHCATKSQSQDKQLLEARVVARFDHPHIVQIYDVGRLDDGRLFIVSKYIDGSNLKSRIGDFRDRPRDAARLAAHIAQALDYAHQQHVYHRDVKPANILLDTDDRPYLADFGLALVEDQRDGRGSIAGTPPYMSPEQARGESHLVDRRSDVFSLAAVLYELATSARAFPGKTRTQVLRQVQAAHPRPPVSVNQDVPTELERIILKGLRRRAGDRYETAADMAADLLSWCQSQSTAQVEIAIPSSITPRGLGAYHEDDANFFLRLIPGPRTRDGLPESIDFWKQRIESPLQSKAFRVGVLYGPSGCGKSSYVTAGLQPRLRDTICLNVRAAPGKTTDAWLQVLRDEFPQLGDESSLADAMRRIRNGLLPIDRKLLIVVDQFEQWLSSTEDIEASRVVAALRQCDGIHTQALLLVRDDFWAPLTRCLQAADVELDAHNSRMLDAFEPAHACRVLMELGRGYGVLAEAAPGTPSDQDVAFVDEVVGQIAQTGPLIPVRISLFAHAFRDRPWNVEQLQSAGGFAGIHELFLENITREDPTLSLHQLACAHIFTALLPPAGKLIKDQPRSVNELSQISGINRETCQQILGTLETKYPIVAASDASAEAEAERKYQLAHDYLVPIVREWSSRKLGSTYQGRMENALIERTNAWQNQPTARALPSLTEWLGIFLFSRRSRWGRSATAMMATATRWYASRAVLALILTMLLVGVAIRGWKDRRAQNDIDRLLTASHEELPEMIAQLHVSSYFTSRLNKRLEQLERAWQRDKSDPRLIRQRVHAQLGLLACGSQEHVPEVVLDYLGVGESPPSQIASPSELQSVAQVMTPFREDFAGPLWEQLATESRNHVVLRMSGVLATAAPEDANWADPEVQNRVVQSLLSAPSIELAAWSQVFAPAMHQIVSQLLRQCDKDLSTKQRESLACLLAEHATARQLAPIIPAVTATQLAILIPKIRNDRSAAKHLRPVLQKLLTPDVPDGAAEGVVRQVDAKLKPFEGAAARQAAFAFAIPTSKTRSVMESLRKGGYYPLCYRPYQTEDGQLVTIGWRFGSRKCEVAEGMRADDFKTRNEQFDERGWQLSDFTCYQLDRQETRFAALWCESPDTSTKVRVSQVTTREAQNSVEMKSRRDHFYPARCCLQYDLEGVQRWSTVWYSSPPNHSECATLSYIEDEFRDDYIGYLATDLQLWGFNLLKDFPQPFVAGFLENRAKQNTVIAKAWERLQAGEIEQLRRDNQLQAELAKSGYGLRYQMSWGGADDTRSRVLTGDHEVQTHSARCSAVLADGWWPHALAARACLPPSGMRYASVWHKSLPSLPQLVDTDSGVANLAIGLAEVGDVSLLAEILNDDCGRQARALLLDRLHFFDRLFPILVSQFKAANDRQRSNIVQGLAEFVSTAHSDESREVIAEYAASPSAELSSAVRYALTKLNVSLDPIEPPPEGQWFVNSLGLRMIRVSAPATGDTIVGAPCWEPGIRPDKEIQHKRPLVRDFALSATEITNGNLNRFLNDPKVVDYFQDHDLALMQATDPNDPQFNRPCGMVSYITAMLFCQWLTELDGLPESEWCYPGVFESKPGEYTMPTDVLDRSGYRLPTEAEYEYACRAGSTEARHFGAVDVSLRHYGWYQANSQGRTHRVGSLRPNEFGFFDLLGNVREWCHDHGDRRWSQPANEDDYNVQLNIKRPIRGGCYTSTAVELRSASRATFVPVTRNQRIGFRVARTMKITRDHSADERVAHPLRCHLPDDTDRAHHKLPGKDTSYVGSTLTIRIGHTDSNIALH